MANSKMKDRRLFLDELGVDASTATWKGENEIIEELAPLCTGHGDAEKCCSHVIRKTSFSSPRGNSARMRQAPRLQEGAESGRRSRTRL